MNHLLYSYSLCIALPLMLFFGIYFLFAQVPDKAIFANYLRSRRIMGLAVLLLSLNYSVHFFLEVRFWNVYAAILMNMSTYYLCYWLFGSALITLLDRHYITSKRLTCHLLVWIIFSVCASCVLFLISQSVVRSILLSCMAVWLIAYGVMMSASLLKAYHKSIRYLEESHSDDIGAYIRWLSVFTYWAVIFGVGCSLLTFLPDRYIYVWILSSVPFYIYLYCCYQNYLLFYEQVEVAIETDADEHPSESPELSDAVDDSKAQSFYDEIAHSIEQWTKAEGYLRPRLTIKQLADTLHTNRTYLSRYINDVYQTTYREWITSLRMEHAKKLMLQSPEQKIANISESCGFLSPSHFMKAFKEREGCSPAKWKKQMMSDLQ